MRVEPHRFGGLLQIVKTHTNIVEDLDVKYINTSGSDFERYQSFFKPYFGIQVIVSASMRNANVEQQCSGTRLCSRESLQTQGFIQNSHTFVVLVTLVRVFRLPGIHGAAPLSAQVTVHVFGSTSGGDWKCKRDSGGWHCLIVPGNMRINGVLNRATEETNIHPAKSL